jgi:hypothetical protein
MFEDDIDAVYTDLGAIGATVDVIHDDTTIQGILDRGEAIETSPEGLTLELPERSVLIPTGDLSPAVDDTITVDGTVYSVRDIKPEPRDGLLTRIVLA